MPGLFIPSAPVQWCWTTLSGPDARDFLHRVSTVNVRDLEPGHGAPGFFLNPQGRIRAWFRLWCFGRDDFSFEYDAGSSGHWRQELLQAIDQYTFAERMQLADLSAELSCRWIVADSPEATLTIASCPAPGQTIALSEEIRLCHQGSRDFGRAWVTAWGREARLEQWIDRSLPEARRMGFGELDALRIEANRPWLGHELTDQVLPLEIGLKDGIAENKGCYPGQEVIEKIVALGSPPRRLARIAGTGNPPRPGEKILNLADPGVEVGEVTSVHASGGVFTALGLLKKIHAKEGLEVRFSGGGGQGLIRGVASYV
jgi:folate-binding protein YgfZ